MLVVQNVKLDAVLRHAVELRRYADVGADGKAGQVHAASANRHGALGAVEAREHAANQVNGDFARIGTPHDGATLALATAEVPRHIPHLGKRSACKADGDAGAVDGHGLSEDVYLCGPQFSDALTNLAQLSQLLTVLLYRRVFPACRKTQHFSNALA